MRVLLTGGLGLIGLETIKVLHENGCRVICFDRRSALIDRLDRTKFSNQYITNVYEKLSLVEDFIDTESPSIGSFDAVIHLAALVDTMADTAQLLNENVDITRQIVDRVSDNYSGGMPVVFASSAATYGNRGVPINPYGLTKVLGEKLVKNHLMNSIALRFFNVYGPYEHHKGMMASMPFKISRAYASGDTMELFDPDASRDFIHVNDVAKCLTAAVLSLRNSSDPQFKAYDVGTGTSETFDSIDRITMQVYAARSSCCKIMDRPLKLKDSYQIATRAGVYVQNYPDVIGLKPRTLREGILELRESMR